MARKQAMSGEDTTVITSSTNSALNEYKSSIPNVSVTDLLQSFDGSKSDLARALAGVRSGQLPSRGTEDRRHYDTQMKNISRWMNYENGIRDKNKARNPEFASSSTQDRFKDLHVKDNPPGDMSITISGWIGYDDDYRYRTVTIPAPGDGRSIDASAFLEAMQAGDTHAAYREVFAAYAPGLSVAQADSIDISFSE